MATYKILIFFLLLICATVQCLDSASNSLPSAESNESMNDSPQSVESNESMNDSPQSAESNESVHDSPQSAESNESMNDSPQSAESNESKNNSPQSAESNESKNDSPQSAESNESMNDSPQSAESNESMNDSPQSAESNESKNDSPQSAESNESMNDSPRSGESNESISNEFNSESINAGESKLLEPINLKEDPSVTPAIAENGNVIASHTLTEDVNNENSSSEESNEEFVPNGSNTEPIENTNDTETTECKRSGTFIYKNNCRRSYTCLDDNNMSFLRLENTCSYNRAYSVILGWCLRDISSCDDVPRCTRSGKMADPQNSNAYFLCMGNKIEGFNEYYVRCDNNQNFNSAIDDCVTDLTKMLQGEQNNLTAISASDLTAVYIERKIIKLQARLNVIESELREKYDGVKQN